MSAGYEVRDGVAVITMNNPPVNGLGLDNRRGIADGLQRAQDDAGVKTIVFTGAGRAFSGGADIREFNSPQMNAEPNLHSVIAMILDDLLDSDEFDKVSYAMVDFGRKIASQRHREAETRARLATSGYDFPRVAFTKQVMIGDTHQDRIKNWLRTVEAAC